LTGGKAEVDATGASIREVFEDLDSHYGGLKEKVFDDTGEIRRFIIVSLNGEDVRYLDGPDTPVKAGDEITIVPAIAGGTSWR
jgi:molybdopterin synthase sulfur carrier subunit